MRNNYAYVNENMFIIIKYYIFREIERQQKKKKQTECCNINYI